MNVAVIPARGGSKRIPRKNLKPFCGQPMIAWPIAAARQAGCFDRILVSTDDDEIAAVATGLGAEVPFRRPAPLADDHATTGAVMAHAAQWLRQHALSTAHICCIYATAPFLQPEDLSAGLRMLQDRQCDYVFSAARYAFPIQRALRITASGAVEMFHPEHRLTRSQDLEPAYHDAGQFYWGRIDAWLQERPIFSASSAALVLPSHRVQDIDTPEDWERAEVMFQVLQRQSAPGH